MARPLASASHEFLRFIHQSKRYKTRAAAAARGVMRGVVKDAADAYTRRHGTVVSPAARASAVNHLLVTASHLTCDEPTLKRKR